MDEVAAQGIPVQLLIIVGNPCLNIAPGNCLQVLGTFYKLAALELKLMCQLLPVA